MITSLGKTPHFFYINITLTTIPKQIKIDSTGFISKLFADTIRNTYAKSKFSLRIHTNVYNPARN